MSLKSLIVALCAAVPLCGPTIANAIVIYDNGASAAGVGWNGSDTTFSSGFYSADDFTLSGGDTITSVFWNGTYSDVTPPFPTDDFTIRIFADSAGVPGAQIGADIVIGAPDSRVDTGLTTSDGLNVFAFEQSGLSIALTLGTTYWLSIVNSSTNGNTPTTGEYAWTRTSGAGGGSPGVFDTVPDFGTPTTVNEFAFRLEGPATGGMGVPEPASMGLASLALIAGAGLRRRRRRG